MKVQLPLPTQEELRLGCKVDYMTRILASDITHNHKITIAALADAASKTFNDCFLMDCVENACKTKQDCLLVKRCLADE